MGLPKIRTLQMVKLLENTSVGFTNKILSNYSDVFGKDLGTLPYVHDFSTRPNVTPMIHTPRRVPLAIKPKVKEELSREKKMEVIEYVTDLLNGSIFNGNSTQTKR